MGWVRCRDDQPDWVYDHEGYVVGVVREDGDWRELGTGDEGRDRLDHVQAACACGWRSHRMVAPLGTEWMRYSVLIEERHEEAAMEWWSAHVDELLAAEARDLSLWLLRPRRVTA